MNEPKHLTEIGKSVDIEEVREARNKMEEDIYLSVFEAMSAFREKTGMSPQRIDIHLVKLTTISDHRPHYLVEEVQADVQL